MKTVQLTKNEINELKAAAQTRLENLALALSHADTVAARRNIEWAALSLESALMALGRAE